MLCPLKFSHYEFEGGQDCIGSECGMRKLCGANDTLAVENDVSEVRMDANDVNAMQDSRERLEADSEEKLDADLRGTLLLLVDDIAKTAYDQSFNKHLKVGAWWNAFIRLLDRQAAITEQRHIELTGAFQLESDKRITELQAKVDELTSELTAARNAHAQAEHEAVILREKLGRALDYAHEITSVGGDC